MNILALGRGKTGSLVAEVASESGHNVRVMGAAENPESRALTAELLHGFDVVIDFTTPEAALSNISACVRAGKNIVVGTTGWYSEMPYVREMVERAGTGLVWGANFSIGVNIFFDVVRTAAEALNYGYAGQIMERHHVHKKDAPSGTAIAMQRIIEERSGTKLQIGSVREGDTVGMHVLMLDSNADSMLLTHDAKNRLGFAQGAVRAAEWIAGRTGFYDFSEIYRQV